MSLPGVRSDASRWTAAPVDRRTELAGEEFLRSYVDAHQPVHVVGAVDHWPALEKWTPEWLVARNGTVPIRPKSDVTLADVLESIHRGPGATAHYARNIRFDRLRVDLGSDIQPLPDGVLSDNWLRHPVVDRVAGARFAPELFFGPADSRFPYLHWDSSHVHANLFMVRGRKEVALFHPDQTPFLYPRANQFDLDCLSEIPDPHEPDFERFPLYAEARGTLVMLEPGDQLFIPGGWWHAVRSTTPSISVVVKLANASNWQAIIDDFPQRYRRLSPARPLSEAYLRLVRRLLSR